MKSLHWTIRVLLVSLLLANTATAAQDYNSSRSNNIKGVTAPDELTDLLRRASADAEEVGNRMIAIRNAQDPDGSVRVSVEVNVKIEKLCSVKDAEVKCPPGQVVCVCEHP